jgi:predicted O-methyltransferase YrrM
MSPEPVRDIPSESRHTPPRPDCPHPEWWHAPDSEATETEVSHLIAALVGAIHPELCVETGSHLGHTAQLIGQALSANGHGHLYSLEVDPARAAAARTATAGLPVTVLEQSSVEWTPPGQLDLCFIDSLYELRKAEILLYRPHLRRPGGIVVIHDTTSAQRGHYWDVRADVEALEAEGVLRPVFLATPRGVAICEVL